MVMPDCEAEIVLRWLFTTCRIIVVETRAILQRLRRSSPLKYEFFSCVSFSVLCRGITIVSNRLSIYAICL